MLKSANRMPLSNALLEKLDIESIQEKIDKAKSNLEINKKESAEARQKIKHEINTLNALLQEHLNDSESKTITDRIEALEDTKNKLDEKDYKEEEELLKAEEFALKIISNLVKISLNDPNIDKAAANAIKIKVSYIRELQQLQFILNRIDRVINRLAKEQSALSALNPDDLDFSELEKTVDRLDNIETDLDKLNEKRNETLSDIEKLQGEVKDKSVFVNIVHLLHKTKAKEDVKENRENLATHNIALAKEVITKYHSVLKEQIVPNIPNDSSLEKPLIDLISKLSKVTNSMRSLGKPHEKNDLLRVAVLFAPAIYNILSEGLLEGLKENDLRKEADVSSSAFSNNVVTEQQKEIFERRRQKFDKKAIIEVNNLISSSVPEIVNVMKVIPKDYKVWQGLLSQSGNATKLAKSIVNFINKFSKIYPNAVISLLAYIEMIKSVEFALNKAYESGH